MDSEDNPILHKSNPGFHILAEQTVYREKADPAQGLAVFGRVGFADSNVNQFRSYTGIGGVYTGLIPGRDQDQIGFAITAAHNGGKFKQAQFDAEMPIDNSEMALELTYRAQITPYFVVQPDFQYIINPGTDPTLKNAFVNGIRFELSF